MAPTLQPGAWCALAPLFGNHFLPCTSIPGVVPGGLQSVPVPRARSQFHMSGGKIIEHVRTVGDLCRSFWVIHQAVANQQPHPLSPGNFSNAEGELDYVHALFHDMPVEWLRAAFSAVQHSSAQPPWPPSSIPTPPESPSAAEQCVEAMLVSRLGWQGLPGGKVVSVANLTVKSATSLQLAHVKADRYAKHAAFVASALASADPSTIDVGVKRLHATLRKLWKRVKWDNFFKEVYWRMIVNGLPTAARMHQASSHCLCNSVCPDLKHHYWDCPIAQAVVRAVLSQLTPAWCTRVPGACPVQQQHVWLMQPPAGPNRLHCTVWMVVCLAAINAMDYGRKAANKFQRQVRSQQSAAAAAIAAVVTPATAPVALPVHQPAITQFFQPAAPTPEQLQHNQLVQQHREQRRQQLEAQLQQQLQQQQREAQQLLRQAEALAVAEFWKLVADFVILNPLPHGFDTLPPNHPFMCLAADTHMLQLAPRVVSNN